MSIGYFEDKQLMDITFKFLDGMIISKEFPINLFNAELVNITRILEAFGAKEPVDGFINYYKMTKGCSEAEIKLQLNKIKSHNDNMETERNIIHKSNESLRKLSIKIDKENKNDKEKLLEIGVQIASLNKQKQKLESKMSKNSKEIFESGNGNILKKSIEKSESVIEDEKLKIGYVGRHLMKNVTNKTREELKIRIDRLY